MEASELFAEGKTRAEIARILGVSWRAVHGWFKQWSAGGTRALNTKSKPGPQSKFSDEEVEVLSRHLIQGAMAHGYPIELWTLRRVGRLILETFGKKLSSFSSAMETQPRNRSPSFPRNTCLLMPDFARFPPSASGFRKCGS